MNIVATTAPLTRPRVVGAAGSIEWIRLTERWPQVASAWKAGRPGHAEFVCRRFNGYGENGEIMGELVGSAVADVLERVLETFGDVIGHGIVIGCEGLPSEPDATNGRAPCATQSAHRRLTGVSQLTFRTITSADVIEFASYPNVTPKAPPSSYLPAVLAR